MIPGPGLNRQRGLKRHRYFARAGQGLRIKASRPLIRGPESAESPGQGIS